MALERSSKEPLEEPPEEAALADAAPDGEPDDLDLSEDLLAGDSPLLLEEGFGGEGSAMVGSSFSFK